MGNDKISNEENCKVRITDEYLFNFFGCPVSGKDYDNFHYAIQPYIDIEEYFKDNRLMRQFNSPNNPQDKFLLIIAAKLERTDVAIVSRRLRDIYGE